MAYGTVNVPGASEAEVVALQEEVDKLSEKTGSTGDTGGSAKAGTVFGKLNKIISDIATHMGRWTSDRAGYIDTINANASAIKTKTDTIGTTGDTGGSDTAGTVMGKLNKLISDLAAHISSWTSTRAEAIDTVKTDTDEIKAILSADDALARKFGSAIEIGYGSVARNESVTIEGKGVATVSNSLSSNDCICSIIIDGVSICTNLNFKSKSFDFEFNNSLVLNRGSGTVELSYKYTLY